MCLFKSLHFCTAELIADTMREIRQDYLARLFTVQPVNDSAITLFQRRKLDNELDVYLVDSDNSMDGLDYWNKNKHRFPVLANIVCEELLCVASSAPSERVFSDAKNIEMRKRFHMVEDSLSAYVMVRSGLKSTRINFKA